jgi:hypothetical protein
MPALIPSEPPTQAVSERAHSSPIRATTASACAAELPGSNSANSSPPMRNPRSTRARTVRRIAAASC